MAEILIADDEARVLRNMRALFEREGFVVEVAKDGAEALEKAAAHRYDLVLLDVDMPVLNGIGACRELRARDARLPIVFFTAHPSEVALVRGLGYGGDDYVDKADGPEILLARVRRALARAATYAAPNPELARVPLGRYAVDFDRRAVLRGEEVLDRLTGTEVGILRALLARRGEGLTADEIMSAARGEACAVSPSTLRSHVSRLKAKLRESGALILNDWGGVYRLV